MMCKKLCKIKNSYNTHNTSKWLYTCVYTHVYFFLKNPVYMYLLHIFERLDFIPKPKLSPLSTTNSYTLSTPSYNHTNQQLFSQAIGQLKLTILNTFVTHYF